MYMGPRSGCAVIARPARPFVVAMQKGTANHTMPPNRRPLQLDMVRKDVLHIWPAAHSSDLKCDCEPVSMQFVPSFRQYSPSGGSCLTASSEQQY